MTEEELKKFEEDLNKQKEEVGLHLKAAKEIKESVQEQQDIVQALSDVGIKTKADFRAFIDNTTNKPTNKKEDEDMTKKDMEELKGYIDEAISPLKEKVEDTAGKVDEFSSAVGHNAKAKKAKAEIEALLKGAEKEAPLLTTYFKNRPDETISQWINDYENHKDFTPENFIKIHEESLRKIAEDTGLIKPEEGDAKGKKAEPKEEPGDVDTDSVPTEKSGQKSDAQVQEDKLKGMTPEQLDMHYAKIAAAKTDAEGS